MVNEIFEAISTYEVMDFTNNYQTRFNILEKYLPNRRTYDEFVKVTDYDVDYNPTALAVADNTVAPLAQRPAFESDIMDLATFKLEQRLSDSEIRKIQSPRTNEAKTKAKEIIFNDTERLINAHHIAMERLRGMALSEGIIQLDENNFRPAPWDYRIPADQKQEIDLATDDILEALMGYSMQVAERTGKTLSRMLLSSASMFKLQGNASLRTAVFGTEEAEARRLTQDEVINALTGFVKITPELIVDSNGNNYFWTDEFGAQHPFIPYEKCVLLPNIDLGCTVTGLTAEELTLPAQDGITVQQENGITVIADYNPRPVQYIQTSVSRFNVVYPKANCSVILTDTSDPIKVGKK